MVGWRSRVDHLLRHTVRFPAASTIFLKSTSASAVEVGHGRLLYPLAVERMFQGTTVLPDPIGDTTIEIVGNLIGDIGIVSLFARDQIHIAAAFFVPRHRAEMLEAAARSVEG